MMNSSNSDQIHLVGILALLDLRLTVLRQLNEKASERIIRNGSYWKRTSDNFEALTNGEVRNADFAEAYASAKSDGHLLSLSQMTNYVEVLGKNVRKLAEGSYSPEKTGKVEIHINLYPYSMDQTVRRELRRALEYHFGPRTVVRLVTIKPETLTPENLQRAYAAYSDYSLMEDWLAVHRDALLSHPIPDVTLNLPQLYLPGQEITALELIGKGYKLESSNPWEVDKDLLQIGLAEFVTIDSLPAINFSAIAPDWLRT